LIGRMHLDVCGGRLTAKRPRASLVCGHPAFSHYSRTCPLAEPGAVRPMEMHQIRYFLALCEELNFTRAAKRCNVSQPSLTRAIRMLEEELGGPLFHRERSNTHLSELGRIVKPYLEQVGREAEEALRQAQDFVRLKQTSLRLGLMCTIA